MPPSLHSCLERSVYHYYLHSCFLIAFYLQSAVEEQVCKTTTHFLRSTAPIRMPSRNQQINDGQYEQWFWGGCYIEIKEEPFWVISFLCSESMPLWSIVIILVLPHYFLTHSLAVPHWKWDCKLMTTARMSSCFCLLLSSSAGEFLNIKKSVRTSLGVLNIWSIVCAVMYWGWYRRFCDTPGDFLQLVCLFHGDVGGILRLEGTISRIDSCGWEESWRLSVVQRAQFQCCRSKHSGNNPASWRWNKLLQRIFERLGV